MKKFTGFITILLFSTILTAQIAEVINVTASQRTDGSKIVDIYYNLSEDITFSSFTVTVEISTDGGALFSNSSFVSGETGNGIVAGIGKHIIWNLGAEYYGMFSNQTVIRVIATGRFVEVPFAFSVVQAGEFTYGSGNETRNIPYDYEMMTFEVTNADYAAFLIDAMESGDVWLNGDNIRGFYAGDEYYGSGDYDLIHLPGSRIYWNGTTFIVQEGFGQHPVVQVNWFGANKFAEFYALRLPSDEEWQKGARGNTGFTYPWGNSIDGTYANYQNSGDPYDNGTTPVGFFNGGLNDGFQTNDSQSPYGVYDLSGNAAEWTSNWSPNNGSLRIFKGGSWEWGTGECQSYWWGEWLNSNDMSPSLGFRCVRTISSARADYLLNKPTPKTKAKSNK